MLLFCIASSEIMSRKRAASPSHIDDFDDDFYENNCSSGNYSLGKSIDCSKKADNLIVGKE